MTALSALLGLAALLLLLPCLVLAIECLAACIPGAPSPRRVGAEAASLRPRTAVLVPAHDEAAGIGGTVRALLPQLGPADRLIVIADNCSDGTADAARGAGATVIERHDTDRRGKGYAIEFGLEHLAADPPEVVILVDADCRLSPQGLETLAREAATHDRPVQGEYLLEAPARPSALAVVSALAVLVRNRVRPRGLGRLGMPCQLTGSGMAFPWLVLRAAPATESNLVEDLVMGLELARLGHPPLGCPDVQVGSELPEGDQAALKQRRRWEHGQMATLLAYGPKLLGEGLRRARLDLLALGLDLLVPPLALLVVLLLGAAVVTGGAALLGASALPAAIVGAALALVTIGVLGAWLRFGRQTLPFRYVATIPFYVLAKLPLYLAFAIRGKHKSWERTTRAGETEGPAQVPPDREARAGSGDQSADEVNDDK